MKNYIVTISRTYGSGGKAIGKLLSQRLSIPYCNRELLEMETDYTDEKLSFSLASNGDSDQEEPLFKTDDRMFEYQSARIREIADKGSCLIVGRCADHILAGRDNLIKIYIYASQRNCMRRIMNLYGFYPEEAKAAIASANRERAAYYKHYTGKEWHLPQQYDLCIDSGVLGFEDCAGLIEDYIARRLKANV